MGKLTDRKCKTARAGKHLDGDGLRLQVYDTGARNWIFRYMLNKRSREMGLGPYPQISFAEARELTAHYRKIKASGIDPIEHREAERRREAQAATTSPTFTTCAARYIRAHRHGWTSVRSARNWRRSLKPCAGPVIGDRPVDEVGTADVLAVLTPIWTTKTETATKVQSRIENVLDYAAAHQWRDAVNPARWRGHLDKLLPKPSKVRPVEHYPAMPYTDVPAFILELAGLDSVSALALRFLILTVTRTSEALQATWKEIDLEARIWTVPAPRMKSRKEHRVPLSAAAVDVLKSVPRFDGNLYVFPGAHYGRPLSNMALLQLMRGMGYGLGRDRGPYVPPGFRSSFRDWSGEVSSFPRDVAEMALAHVIENKVEAAYRRGDLFAKRRKMMEAWSSYCLQRTVDETVIVDLQARARG
jgi:integrase